MNENKKTDSLPFITRNMLDFEYASKFELVVFTRAFSLGQIRIVGATKEGTFTYRATTTTSTAGDTARFTIPDLPIWVSITDPDGDFKQGNLFVKVELSLNNDLIHSLCMGYVCQYKSLTWPMISTQETAPTIGQMDVTTSADPAAGAELTYTMNDAETWRIIAITFTLVTDATVTNRRVHIQFNPKQNGIFDIPCSVDQGASLTRKYHCVPIGTLGAYSDDNDIIIPIPDNLFLQGESKITTQTTNLQLGDNLGVMTIHRERFIAPMN